MNPPYRQGFPTMTALVPEGRHGDALVRHHQITPHEVMMSTMRGMPTEQEPVAILQTERGVEMSDSYHERLTNWEVVQVARGDVLIAGLGLGMIIHPLVRKPDVTSVTVVEINPDVIALIRPTLPEAVTVVEGDIFTWAPPPGVKYDTIYFDIWPNISADLWPEMKTLTKRARSWRKPRAWVSCWVKQQVQALARGDRAWR